MKNTGFVLFLFASSFCAAQKEYWQQKVDITIQVQLNDTEHTADGFEKIIYKNNSPDTLHYIWFHLWPNAYKNDKTAFSNQMLELGNTAFYFSSGKQLGYINRLGFKVGGVTAKWEDHPQHIDIIKLLLPEPLPPASQITITTPFHLKLPYLFSRSGYKDGTFQLTQWYPKPAVYDAQGWHPMPYLEQGEFYAEFGDYDVTITLPKDYVVAATGVLQNEEERKWLKNKREIITKEKKQAAASSKPYGHLKKLPASPKKKTTDTIFFKTPYPTKTLRFKQQNVHDFALIGNKNFSVDFDTCRLPSGRLINVFTYYVNKPRTAWKKSLQFTKDALRFYSAGVGDYPYASMHVAESAASGGGMEYPTLTLIGSVASEKTLDILIAHETGHNWFYGALANNERDEPWLDEGMNTFYEKKYRAQKYGPDLPLEERLFQTLVKQKKDQPITTASQNFSSLNYALTAYDKTSRWFSLIEQKLGPEIFQQTMQDYFKQWRFKHPTSKDFKKVLSAALPDTTLFALLDAKGTLPAQPLSRLKIISPLAPATIKNYLNYGAKNSLLISPAAGYNKYDKAMIGGVFTNYGLPPTAFQFIAVPMYATGSKKWTGIGNISYSIYPAKRFHKIEAAVSGMGFSKSYMLDSNGAAHYERFYKVAPSVRFTFNQPVQSTKETWLEAKSFLITEHNFSKFVTKTTDGLTYVDSLAKQSRYINQFTYNVSDYRALYPYHYRLQIQQGQAFYRINASGDYFFNYAKGGGAGVRLFFAQFGYLANNSSQRFATTRYQPKLLGVTGEEDYSYSSYILGRTASYANNASVVKASGLAAQQIALRDGAFKLRLDQFEFLQGRSENWVAALNFNTTLPGQLLPLRIPLKLFLDIGTYAEAKESESITNRILYVGGLQLSLLKNILNIYAPVVYSRDFRDNLKSLPEQNTFLKRLTFSIDFSQLSVQRITRNKLSL